MHKFVRNLLTEWRKLGLPLAGETFIVAVSGGADSVGLAAALADLKKRKKLNLRFVIAHFNHDLRGAESEKDAEFVRNLAEAQGFESVGGISGFEFQISKAGNLEQNARRARYEFLMETARNFEAFGILTAHTINDQAETFLLNLIRGSGMTGLSGMKPVIPNYELRITNRNPQSAIRNPQSAIALVRPLLNWATREATENFCRFNEIEYRRDAMNDDPKFNRVKVRKILIPLLKEFNPKIVETLANTAKLMQTENADSAEAQTALPKNRFLVLKDLQNLPNSALYNILREWLKTNRGNLRQLDLHHIEALERLIFSRKSGRIVELPGSETVVKKDGKLFWERKNIENIGQST
jgi:tRNA(Ile)-lysidine synthase